MYDEQLQQPGIGLRSLHSKTHFRSYLKKISSPNSFRIRNLYLLFLRGGNRNYQNFFLSFVLLNPFSELVSLGSGKTASFYKSRRGEVQDSGPLIAQRVIP